MTAPGPSSPIEVVALDGDDTLWHSEVAFKAVEARFVELVGAHVDVVALEADLLAVERQNLRRFGYGVKSFVLSMIETAITITDGSITAREIHEIVDLGKWLLDHPVELLPGVAETVPVLAGHHRLVLVTKGDLLHQESKVAASGLADHFEAVHIVSEKDAATYARIVAGLGIEPGAFLMAGNSLRSDVAPVLAIGGHGVHIPHEHEWDGERPDGDVRAPVLDSLVELAAHLGL